MTKGLQVRPCHVRNGAPAVDIQVDSRGICVRKFGRNFREKTALKDAMT